jgi:1-acyl-sn-glycerol-3-phosphate acyltransferase
MALVRSLLFAVAFYAGTCVAVLAALIAALFGRRHVIAMAVAWARFHRWCAANLLGIRTRVEGAVPTAPTLVASKHQSMFETLELVLLLGPPAVVVKRELADIPAWGWAARRYGVIPVDRAGGADALRQMLHAARQAVAEGRVLLIFPEGTRVPPGESPSLQAGFAGLYRALDLPVVPIALDSGHLWPRHRFVKRPGVVTMRFGEPIPPGLPRRDIEARVHAAINVLEASVGEIRNIKPPP